MGSAATLRAVWRTGSRLYLRAAAQDADAARKTNGPSGRGKTKERQGRHGGPGGLSADKNDLPALLGRLKAACGAGGTIKDDELELQGDHLERLRGLLAGIGYRLRG